MATGRDNGTEKVIYVMDGCSANIITTNKKAPTLVGGLKMKTSRLRVLLLVLFLNLFATPPALADCRWTWDCSKGSCRQVQVCDSTIDSPRIRPPEIAPIPSPSIEPIPRPTIPPVGTSQCAQRYLCDSRGNCNWQTVCR